MKQLRVFFATILLTCFSFLPLSAFADDLDDLDVTMEVIDDMSRIKDIATQMRGPESDDDDGDDDDESDDDDHDEDRERDESDDGDERDE